MSPCDATIPPSETIERRLRKYLQLNPCIFIGLDIVNKCNLRCIMCHFNNDSVFHQTAEYLTPENFRLFYEGISSYIQQVRLSGGYEPLMSKYFPEILNYLSNLVPQQLISFCTNGMLMNEKMRHLMIEKGVTRVIISMDGATKSTYERIRVGSKYDRVVGNILALRDIKQASGVSYPTVKLNYVMINSNIHEAPVFVELAKCVGAETIDFRHAVPSMYFNDHNEMLDNYKAKYNYYRGKIIEASLIHNIKIMLSPPYNTTELWKPEHEKIPEISLKDFENVKPDISKAIPQYISNHSSKINKNSYNIANEFKGVFCISPFSTIIIRDFEEVLPCEFYKRVLGRLNTGKTLKDIFFGEEFRKLRHNMFQPDGDPGCSDCPIKSNLLPSKVEETALPIKSRTTIAVIASIRTLGRLIRGRTKR